MKNRISKLFAAVTAVICLAVAPATSFAAGEVVLGFFDDMSMSGSETGADALHAVQFAVDEANAAGGIKGKKVRLISYDGKQDPQLTGLLVTRFAEEDKGLLMIGGNPAIPTTAAIRVANEEKLPFFSLSAATDSLTNPPTPYHFRFGPANGQDAAAVAGFVAERGFKRVAIINNSVPYGLDGGIAIEKALKAAGVNVVAHETYDTNATDLTPQVIKIRAAKPDVVIIWPYPADGGRVLRTLAQLNVDAVRLVARIALYESMRKMAGEAGDGALVTNTVDVSRPEVAEFFKKFGEKYGQRPPTMYIAMAYDAAKVALQVSARPEVQEALAKGDIEGAREKARDAVETIGRFKGIQGKSTAAYSFSKTRHQGPPDADWFVWMELKDTQLVQPDLSKIKPK